MKRSVSEPEEVATPPAPTMQPSRCAGDCITTCFMLHFWLELIFASRFEA